MERIRLTKDEKYALLYVAEHGGKQPPLLSPVKFHFALSTLQEKGLIVFKSNYEEIISAGLTIKGTAYLEYNPKLKNPIMWKDVALIVLSAITAISTFLALFVACSFL